MQLAITTESSAVTTPLHEVPEKTCKEFVQAFVVSKTSRTV